MGFASWCNKTVAVFQKVETLDKQKASAITYPAQTGTIQCMIDPAKADEFVAFGQKQFKVSHRVYCVQNPNVDARDLLVYNGRNLWVLAVKNTAEQNELWVIECMEGKQGPWA